MLKKLLFVSKLGVAGMVVMAMTACGSASTSGYLARLSPPTPEKFTSSVNFSVAYTDGKEQTGSDGLRSVRERMCGVAFGASRKNLYLTSVGDICARQGGVYQRPLCMDKNDNVALFAADAQDTPAASRLCNSTLEDFYVTAAEPGPTVQPQDFTVLMSRLGFKTKTSLDAEAVQRRKKEQAELKSRMELQAMMVENERQARFKNLPQIRKIGAKICQPGTFSVGNEKMRVISVGYVEGITDEKVQIRIASAYFEKHPNLSPGGFSPSIIWDTPMSWDLCR